MKRFVFTLIVILLFALFGFLYTYEPLRRILVANNVGVLVNVYSSLDTFINTVWDYTFSHFITLGGTSSQQFFIKQVVVISSIALIIILVVDIIATIIYNAVKHSKQRNEYLLGEEKRNLSQLGDSTAAFSKFDENNKTFSNSQTPYITLSNNNVSSNSQVMGNLIEQENKKRPVLFIVLSIVYFILAFIWLIFRFIFMSLDEESATIFTFLFNTPFFDALNTNLDAFFLFIYRPFRHVSFTLFNHLNLTLVNIFEIITIIVLVVLVWFIFKLIHKLIKKSRRNKVIKAVVNQNSGSSLTQSEVISKMNLLLLNEGENISGNFETLGTNLNKNDFEINQNKLLKKLDYLSDISSGVEYVGKTDNESIILPSKERKPFVLEPIQDDISKNIDVNLEDIPVLDEQKKEEINNEVKIDYVRKEEFDYQIDLNSTNILEIANINIPLTKNLIKVEDIIMFDAEGDAYLASKGELIHNQEEDISDVIIDNKLNTNAIISQIGLDNYTFLNEIEPFALHPLDVNEEIKKSIISINQSEVTRKYDQINEALSKPFVSQDKAVIETQQEIFEDVQEQISESLNDNPQIQVGLMTFKKQSNKKLIAPVEPKKIAINEFEKSNKKDE